MLFSLFHAKFVRAAGIITPDLPVFDDQLIGAAIRRLDRHFLVFRQVQDLSYLTAAGDFCSGSFFSGMKILK